MSDRPVALLIEDIWEATGKVSRFTRDTFQEPHSPPVLSGNQTNNPG